MNHRLGSKRLTYLSGLLIVAWVVYLVVLIAHRPDDGAADPDELAAAFSTAITDRDHAGVKRLVEAEVDTPVLDRLVRAAQCGRVMHATSTHIEIFRDDGARCGRLPIAQHSGRWFIDPWADPLQPTS